MPIKKNDSEIKIIDEFPIEKLEFDDDLPVDTERNDDDLPLDTDGVPEWEKGFSDSLFEKPDFPITLKPRLNVVYELTIKDFPKEPVKTSIGESYIMEVYNDKMVNSIFINRSLGFSLAKIRRQHNWKLSDLIGKKILLQKTEGKKDGKDTYFITAKLVEYQ